MSNIPTYDFDTYVDRFGFVYAASAEIAKNAEAQGLKFIPARAPQPTEVDPLPPPPNNDDTPVVISTDDAGDTVVEVPHKTTTKKKEKTVSATPAAATELDDDIDAELNAIDNLQG